MTAADHANTEGNLVRLPLPKDGGVWDATNERWIRRCEGIIHVYASVPGRCQCGENYWDGETPDA